MQHSAFGSRRGGKVAPQWLLLLPPFLPPFFLLDMQKRSPRFPPLISPEIFVPLHKRSGNKRKRKRDVGKIRCRRTTKSDCLFALCASRRALFFDKRRGGGICCLKSSSFGLARAGFYFFICCLSPPRLIHGYTKL